MRTVIELVVFGLVMLVSSGGLSKANGRWCLHEWVWVRAERRCRKCGEWHFNV